jgi:hypothetical protein
MTQQPPVISVKDYIRPMGERPAPGRAGQRVNAALHGRAQPFADRHRGMLACKSNGEPALGHGCGRLIGLAEGQRVPTMLVSLLLLRSR